jgi:DNA anti-recombination protein RmuC
MSDELDQRIAEIAAEREQALEVLRNMVRELHSLAGEMHDLRNALRLSSGDSKLPPLPPLLLPRAKKLNS